MQRSLSKDEDRAVILEGYKASLMSDTKWRKVFTALEAVDPSLKILVKWVGVEGAQRAGLPHIHAPYSWADFFHCGPTPLRSIEWLEIPSQDVEVRGKGYAPVRNSQPIDAVRRALRSIGRLPVEDLGDGVRIVGHVANGATFPSSSSAL